MTERDPLPQLFAATRPEQEDAAYAENRRRFLEETLPRARLRQRIEAAALGLWRELEGPLEDLPRGP